MKSQENLLQSTAKDMWFTSPEFLSANGNDIGETDLEVLQDNNEEIKIKDFLASFLDKSTLV